MKKLKVVPTVDVIHSASWLRAAMQRERNRRRDAKGGDSGRNELGAELVEFALSSAVFFIFIFGVFELCLVLFMYNTAAGAARETTRWASVRGALCSNLSIGSCPATLSQVQDYGKTLPGAGNMSVQVWWCNSDGQTNCVQNPSNAQQGNVVKVNVSYTFASVPFVSKGALTVASTSAAVIWQ